MQPLFLFALSFTVCCALGVLALPFLLAPSKDAERLFRIVQSNRQDRRTVSGSERFRDQVLAYAGSIRKKLRFAENVQIKKRLAETGFRGENASDLFFAAQGVCVLIFVSAASFIPGNTFFWVMIGAVLGFMAPDFWLTAASKRRRERIRRSIPDAVDLLVICVDAGLGLDQALLRVGEELDISHPEINQEFNRINLEQRAGTPRIEAWKGLAERTRIEEFSAFVTMLTQTDRFGTPILKALVTFSEDLRLKRRQHAEEAAAKTKIKILFPLVLCIFPCIFIVLLAPAILSIMDGMKSMGN
jgi:tight adherence protein C